MKSWLLALTLMMTAAATRAGGNPTGFERGASLFLLKCAKCHTIGHGDRVGPDLRAVTERHEKEWIIHFIMKPDVYLQSDPAAKQLLARFNGVRMEDTHLTEPEAQALWEYLKSAGVGPSAPEAPQPLPEDPLARKLRLPDEGYSPFMPGLALTLLLLALAVGTWQLGMHRLAPAVLVLSAAGAYWSLGGRHYHHLLGNQQGYEPEQPIAFSHAQHAGQLGISCLYCHSGAEKSDVAGVPTTNVCMNCHAAVRKAAKSKSDSLEIAKLVTAWDSRLTDHPQPIEWTRVHNLPAYVHFNHRVHVKNNIQCMECHGPVTTMTRMRQASSLSMGWCIDCHRLQAGSAPTHWKRAGGPLDCAACHQ